MWQGSVFACNHNNSTGKLYGLHDHQADKDKRKTVKLNKNAKVTPTNYQI